MTFSNIGWESFIFSILDSQIPFNLYLCYLIQSNAPRYPFHILLYHIMWRCVLRIRVHCFLTTRCNHTNWSFWISSKIKTFKYHVSCTDGKISLRINLLFYLFFTVVPYNLCVFLSCGPFVVNTTFSTGLEVSFVSWLGQLTVQLQDLLKMLY